MNRHIKHGTSEIAEALFVVNRHAKTAPSPKYLYELKKHAIEKLLMENRAKKIGLHFSDHPKLSRQHSTLLVQVDNYYFHVPPAKKDFQDFKHLGNVDKNFRNPKTRLSLSHAKRILAGFLNWKPNEEDSPLTRRSSSYFTASSLGQVSWPQHKKGNRKY